MRRMCLGCQAPMIPAEKYRPVRFRQKVMLSLLVAEVQLMSPPPESGGMPEGARSSKVAVE